MATKKKTRILWGRVVIVVLAGLLLLTGTGFMVYKVVGTMFNITKFDFNFDFFNKKDNKDNQGDKDKQDAYSVEQLETIRKYLSDADYDLVTQMKYLPELPELVGEDFKIDLLPRYIMAVRNRGKSTSEAVAWVNENGDFIPEDQLVWGDFYKNIVELTPQEAGNYIVMVNKQYKLPSSYEPNDLTDLPNGYYGNNMPLRKVAADQLIKMSDDAVAAGYERIYGQSNYRSYSLQEDLYNRYVTQYGSTEVADKESARPGHSEHQTGLVADVGGGEYMMESFIWYSGYDWVCENMHKYGFIQRYPENKEYITGYEFESWHLRYVGVTMATILHEHNWTMEEYYTVFNQ